MKLSSIAPLGPRLLRSASLGDDDPTDFSTFMQSSSPPAGVASGSGSSFFDSPTFEVIGVGASCAMIYHGYIRNNGSIGWALGWGLLGLLGVPFALAQGFAKPLPKSNPGRRRRRKR